MKETCRKKTSVPVLYQVEEKLLIYTLYSTLLQ